MSRFIRHLVVALLLAGALAALTAWVSAVGDGPDTLFIAKTSEFG